MFSDGIKIKDVYSVICFKSDQMPKFRNYSGKHSHNELILKVDGESKVRFGDKVLYGSPGNIRFFPQCENNISQSLETYTDGTCYDILFDTESPIDQEAFAMQCNNFDNFLQLFVRMESIWRHKYAGYRYEAIGCLYEIFALMINDGHFLRKTDEKYIRPATDYIAEHVGEDILVSELVDMCNTTYETLKKSFVNVYGLTPKEYITRMKLLYAGDLLKTKKYTIAEVSAIVGYRNPYSFSQSFKTNSGISPREYLKKML